MLRVEHLSVSFPGRRRGLFSGPAAPVPAVQDVSFSIPTGKTVGLVGESGSGKTTIGRCLIKLQQPDAGRVLLEGKDLVPMSEAQFLPLRRDIQMIFQDPFGSLNPRLDLLAIIGEPLEIHFPKMPRRERAQRVAELLQKVGLSPDCMGRRPQEFSGGQRQRIGIARSLVCHPKLIVCDEAVSALDVSIQAQILNLLKDMQARFGLSYLFVAHNLAVVEHISQRTAVMYVGKVIELADTKKLFAKPRHPYTEALLSAAPVPQPNRKQERIILRGEVANPANPPAGCYFHPRCSYATDRCAQETPLLREVTPGHQVACHYAETLDLKGMIA